ncbi:hypothetical protein ACIQU5_36275 [Streptomyces sp. NPDC090306]|uniref:hypothetical protein n=1 Tax=Streptomyces sp. NPDC090306 TaxID=3365961 RepID=UPI0037F43067
MLDRAGAESLQHVWRRVRDPLADREQRGGAGQHRARGQREHDGMARPAARIAPVWHLRRMLQQAEHLPGPDVRLLAESVKGRRNQG